MTVLGVGAAGFIGSLVRDLLLAERGVSVPVGC